MITQARFSSAITFFEKDFLRFWGLKKYDNLHEPAIFMGVYNQTDVEAINNHSGFKVVKNTGLLCDVFFRINPVGVIVTGTVGGVVEKEIINQYRYIEKSFPIKDYSDFKPTVMGDCVYCYLGSEGRKDYLGFEVAEAVRKLIPFKMLYGFLGNSMEYLRKNYYNRCFVNLKPSIKGGCTTARELAYMGRYTISNAPMEHCLHYESVGDIANIVMEESNKIGTVQPQVVKFEEPSREWLRVDSWK